MVEHELAHETCGLEGCTYTASLKQVEIHILHLHSTGIYQKKQNDKNELNNRIGTSDEESRKWRDERKKNFPSVLKSEQAKRHRQLKFVRRLKSIETRKQKEFEKEEERKRWQEDREKLSSPKHKRQNRFLTQNWTPCSWVLF